METIEALLRSTGLDYADVSSMKLEKATFEDLHRSRIVNSFLFNVGRLQDNMGAKFFKEVLLELREIDTAAVPMLDVIHKLEKLRIVDSLEEWDHLREIRNALTHDYSTDFDDRVQNVKRAMWAFEELRRIYAEMSTVLKRKGVL